MKTYILIIRSLIFKNYYTDKLSKNNVYTHVIIKNKKF